MRRIPDRAVRRFFHDLDAAFAVGALFVALAAHRDRPAVGRFIRPAPLAADCPCTSSMRDKSGLPCLASMQLEDISLTMAHFSDSTSEPIVPSPAPMSDQLRDLNFEAVAGWGVSGGFFVLVMEDQNDPYTKSQA